MKYILAILLLLFQGSAFSQVTDTLKSRSGKESGEVSFIATVDIANATKDGIYLNGYVVNMGYEQAEKLHGKRIKVTGKVTIVKGLNNDLKNGQEIQQGRSEDTKHLLKPKIKIIG